MNTNLKRFQEERQAVLPLFAPAFNFTKIAVNIVPLDVPRVVVTSNFLQSAITAGLTSKLVI
jgi:hypothetical protein